MSEISKIQVSGTAYDIKDATARSAVDTLVEQAVIKDGNTYKVNGTAVDLGAGHECIVTNDDGETIDPADIRTAIVYVKQQNAAALQDEADAKFAVTTSGSATLYTDANSSTTLAVTVTTKFDGEAVDCDSVPTGWTRTATGTYTKSVSGASGSVTATTFSYTPSSGTYKDITVSKSSTAKIITVVNPVYYGFTTATTLADAIGDLTRSTSKVSVTSLTNSKANGAYLWILTKNSATATQLGQSILGAATTNQSFTSPQDSSITCSGYKLYKSTSPFDMGTFNVSLTINI